MSYHKDLEDWINSKFASETEVMNVLQDYGVISDNCVGLTDVGNGKEAAEWLDKNFERVGKTRV